MNALTRCNTAISKLEQLVQSGETTVPGDKLELFYAWIEQQCCYLEKEQKPFAVSQEYIPTTLTTENYNFLANKISEIVRNYYEYNGIEYKRNGIPMSDSHATAIYCRFYLSPRKIVWIDFGFNIGSEFGGKHPAIILKNLNNDVLIVAPVSTNDNNSHAPSSTAITFSKTDMYNMPSMRERFTNITRITPVSIYRLDTKSKVGSLKKEKYQELLGKIRNYY